MKKLKFESRSFLALSLSKGLTPLVLAVALAGCAGAPAKRVSGTPVGGFADNSQAETAPAVSMTLWFGTDRVPAASDQGVSFTSGQAGLLYGRCEVTLPPSPCRGRIELPSWCRPETAPVKEFLVRRASILTSSDFAQALGEGASGETFLFVHGFNVSFKEAAQTTAQMAHDLRLSREPLMYCWASRENVLQYNADENSVQNTRPRFQAFLENVLAAEPSTKIHLVAHSMGTRALTETLSLMREKGADLSRIGQIVLLAADIDALYFQEQLYGRIWDIGDGFTIYSSSKDLALKASATVAGSVPRLGQAGGKLTVMDGMTTVDASFCADNCTLCHSLAGIPCVLNDLYLLLNRKLAPEDRLMDRKGAANLPRPFYQLYDINCSK